MGTRKSMTLPIIITFIIIGVIVYLFATIKQTEVVCEKTYTYDSNIFLKEHVVATIDGKKIDKLDIQKTIILPEKYLKDDTYLNMIKENLDRTLEYLGDKVKYTIGTDRITVDITVSKNEVVLLDNIDFKVKDGFQIIIDSNTKSSDVITLKVGDNYTDGEFMKKLKEDGYSCK